MELEGNVDKLKSRSMLRLKATDDLCYVEKVDDNRQVITVNVAGESVPFSFLVMPWYFYLTDAGITPFPAFDPTKDYAN